MVKHDLVSTLNEELEEAEIREAHVEPKASSRHFSSNLPHATPPSNR